ncbi:MAG: J domain-containing protein [Alphaproteobacteria bacterium]
MTDSFDYKPPFGFDIRVKPASEKKSVRREPEKPRPCEWQGCTAAGACRVRAAPDRPNEYRWYCQAHARDHNQAWDYFRGKTAEEIAAFQAEASTGHRPTWSMGVNGWSRDELAAERRRRSFRPGRDTPGRNGKTSGPGAQDPYNLFKGGEGGPKAAGDDTARKRTLSRLQRSSLTDLGLDESADADAVKARYKELVKRFHPDANGGDRGAEESLRRVIRAYQTLRASGFR